MRAPLRVAALPLKPRATTLRTFATRTSTVDTLRARRKTSARPAEQSGNTSEITPSQGVFFGSDWTHWESSSHNPFTADDRARALYSTQIYNGQRHTSPASTPPPTIIPKVNSKRTIITAPPGSGPATGAGTGVPIGAQMFGNEVKGNPTESEADVAADRCDEDPLPPGLHHTICLGAGDAAPRPTESEEDVCADRGTAGVDPLEEMRRGLGMRGLSGEVKH